MGCKLVTVHCCGHYKRSCIPILNSIITTVMMIIIVAVTSIAIVIIIIIITMAMENPQCYRWLSH
jgi:hypothetical protein